MAFPGYPFRKELPSFVHHTDMLSYLQQYTAHYDLEKYISFCTVVEQITPVPYNPKQESDGVWLDGVKWEVSSRHLPSDTSVTEVFDAILVCNG